MIPNLFNPLPEKDRAAIRRWLSRQPPQTVLLFVIVIGGGCSALFQFPAIIDRAVSRLEKVNEIAAATYQADQERDERRQERDERRLQEQQRFIEEVVRRKNQAPANGRQPIVKNLLPAPLAPF